MTLTYSGESKPEKSLLEEAHELVTSKRSKEYGSFSLNMDIATRLFNLLRGSKLLGSAPQGCWDTAFNTEDGTWLLICLKLARESCRHKRDNIMDVAGYLELLDEILEGASPGNK